MSDEFYKIKELEHWKDEQKVYGVYDILLVQKEFRAIMPWDGVVLVTPHKIVAEQAAAALNRDRKLRENNADIRREWLKFNEIWEMQRATRKIEAFKEVYFHMGDKQ